MADWRDWRTIAVIDRGPAGAASTVPGPPGKTGPPGLTGERGERGERGLTGERGLQGIQGMPGQIGATGERGPKGDPGTSVRILGSYDSFAELVEHHPIGAPGDGYLINGVLYVWDAEHDQWIAAGNIRGPAGEPGERGPIGLQGEQGERGFQGERGEQGERGLDGERGEVGPTGEPGFVGRNAFTLTITAPFVVPPIGQTVTARVEQAEWIVPGQMVWVANAAGPNQAASFQVTAVDDDQVTLLNPPPPGQLVGAILTGMIVPYGGEVAPVGYLLCDGASYPRANYPELGEVLGTAYGGDEDNFNVPDLRARVPVGIGGLDYDSSWAWHRGQKYGSHSHTLSIGEMPLHNHGNVDINHNHGVGVNAHGHGDPTHAHNCGQPIRWGSLNWVSGSAQALYTLNHGDYQYWSGNTDARYTGIQNAGNMGGWTDYVSERAANHHLRATNNAGSGAAHNNAQPGLGINYLVKT